jgi:beta-glucanase (GH16 family)
MITHRSIILLTLLASTAYIPIIFADDAPPKVIVDMSAADAASKFVPDDQANGQVTVEASKDPAGVTLTVAPGTSGYPGVWIKPEGGKPWDFSAYGHVEAKITNLGTERVVVVIRMDDDSDGGQTNNADKFALKPGETRVCKALFGYSWGGPSASIKTGGVTSLTIFTNKITTAPAILRIESLEAAGPVGEKLPVNPALVATKPANGVIFGPGVKLDPAQIAPQAGAKASLSPDGTGIDLSLSAPKQGVTVKPLMGTWRLNDQLEVKVKIKNTGQTPATPSVRLESKPGPTDTITASAPLAPGAETEIVVPFASAVTWNGIAEDDQQKLEVKKSWGGEPNTGTLYASCFANGVTVMADEPAGTKSLQITSIVADMPPVSTPDWLGKKPPVDGDWVQTFNDDFDGNTIDLHKWNIYTEGSYHIGAQTHYTKDNVIVKDGTLTLRIDKKTGHHNDDPAQASNGIASGYADTYGKWTQRYGYFEARMKFPRPPSMFLAFWLMPDRGIDTPAGKYGQNAERTSTKDGGMEFDIMETLSLWGPWRHDFGMHWDGYQKYHKANGTFACYAAPDKDGYVTVGMLWTPGQVIMYDNGKEAARWETPRVGSVPEYMILDNVTGGWEADPLDEKQLPGDFVIDYIRVWQRKDLASAVDGPKPNDGGPYPPKSAATPPANP